MDLPHRTDGCVHKSRNLAFGRTRRYVCVGQQQLSQFRKLVVCSLLAVLGVSCAGPRYTARASSDVTRWLLSAEQALADDQLISPPEDSALMHLERVLAKQPSNRKAAELLDQVIVRLALGHGIAFARQELARLRQLHAVSSAARGDSGMARSYAETPQALYKESPRVRPLRVYGTF